MAMHMRSLFKIIPIITPMATYIAAAVGEDCPWAGQLTLGVQHCKQSSLSGQTHKPFLWQIDVAASNR